jgi:hypothetical protein
MGGPTSTADDTAALPTIVYRRSHQQVVLLNPKTQKISYGQRGTLEVRGHSFPTIERMDGYVRLPPGDYVCEHYEAPKNGRTLRPMNHGVISRDRSKKVGYEIEAAILIHAANRSYELSGCFAPGLRETSYGVGDSRAAESTEMEYMAGGRRIPDP